MQPLMITSLKDETLLQHASTLPATGYIQQQLNYCYLKIDDKYVHELYPLLRSHGSINKPPYFHPPKDAGAHISVIYPAEQTPLEPGYLGQTHRFTVIGLIKAQYAIQDYFALAVHAPTLTHLRTAHQLTVKPVFKGQPIIFHITIGIRTNK